MYARLPTIEEAAAIGLTPSAFEGPAVPIWPENRQTVCVFLAMRTQWTYGPGGPVGLNYAALPEVWRRLRVPPAERDDVFNGLQIMERAALAATYED